MTSLHRLIFDCFFDECIDCQDIQSSGFLSSLAGSAPTPSYRFLDISFSLLDDLSSGERNELRLSGELLIRRKGVGDG